MTESQIRKILNRAEKVNRVWSFGMDSERITIEVTNCGTKLSMSGASNWLTRKSAYDLWKRLSILFPNRGYAPARRRRKVKKGGRP